MVAWGPIIGAGISAIGSLFGGKDEETTTTINYKQMAKAAEKAGFNPLTALRNGGSAGFTTTSHPGLSMMDRFGSAFQTIGNALMSYDARADERADLELRIQRAELDRLQKTPLVARQSFDVPTAAGSSRSVSPGKGGGANPPPPPVGSNQEYQLQILGGTPVAGYEPVSAGDDVVVTTDQILRAIRKNWNRPGNMFTDYANWRGVPTPQPMPARPSGPIRSYTSFGSRPPYSPAPPASGARPYSFLPF